jgi:Domain of unknown function (DUF4342)
MTDKTFWETLKAESENVIEKLKALIHEGNVRRIVIQHGGRTVAEFPVTAGVVGVVLAPVLAAIGAIVALLKDCTIQVERVDTKDAPKSQPPPTRDVSGPSGAA